jgi:aminoglycoside/choline kinase family phosphotransferase
VSAGSQQSRDPEVAGERWRDAMAELEYAERHGAPAAEVERLADEVIEARVAMFQAGVSGGWQLPAFLQAALDRDRQLLKVWPADWDATGAPPAETTG